MSGRRIKPENLALQDRICAVLADAWPELLSSTDVAERVGGVRTLWEVCAATRGWECRATDPRRQSYNGWDFNARHHDGPVPQDSWEVRWQAMDMNPHLNRLARGGQAEKVKVQALRSVLWRWAGDTEEAIGLSLSDLKQLWEASQ